MSEQVPAPEAQINFVQWLETLRTDVSESVGGVLLRGARAVPIGIAQNATSRPTTSAGALVGFAVRNAGVAAASVLLRDGDAAGDVVIPITLAPGASARDWFGPGGINLTRGLSVEIVGTDVDGSVFLRGAE